MNVLTFAANPVLNQFVEQKLLQMEQPLYGSVRRQWRKVWMSSFKIIGRVRLITVI